MLGTEIGAGYFFYELFLIIRYINKPQVFGDNRGYFMETFKKKDYAVAGIDKEFVQDNESSSTKGALRGLHFQTNHTQGKLVRVTHGEVFDVAFVCDPIPILTDNGLELFYPHKRRTCSIYRKALLMVAEF